MKTNFIPSLLVAQIVSYDGESVIIQGWVHTIRDMGKIAFMDVRDHTGLVQVVIEDPSSMPKLGNEYVVRVTGVVRKRGERFVNPAIATGGYELGATHIELLSASSELPFEITKDTSAINDETRLKYRYLDLRTERMSRNLRLRHSVVKSIRDILDSKGFIEVETPNLTKGTPEGAREFMVPSRLHPGDFYVLPQSPQQFKQLLMVAGVGRYFQIARCFRDEDQRGDRQPEFTQLDMELSFVEREDVMALNEELLIELVKRHAPEKRIQTLPFPRMTYAESMEQYGTDRPDLREDKTDPNLLAFCWVVDFPFFEKTEDGKSWTFTHNPFSAAIPEHAEWLLDQSHVADILTSQYDIALNGFEIGGGSIRNHKPEALKAVFEIMGLGESVMVERFGHMFEAFKYGAPPHGGIAWGLERLLMVFAGEPNIREVMAFPKTGDSREPMTGAPTPMDSKRLKEVSISSVVPTKKP
jgi:aspartyl-tRNA synthetase